jgi:CheY-like chemotaxis protein/HPt (histidine-containing phosphotransfer) domain-containing protein
VFGNDWSEEQVVASQDAVRGAPDLPATKFVILASGWQRNATIDASDTVAMDANPMRRSAFLNGVAIAAGRASPEVHTEEEVEKIGVGKAPTVEEALARGQLILVAEDNMTNQDVIKRQLNTLGYQCEMTDDGAQGLEAWKSGRYSILLTDCHMPEMDGFELTAAIREAEADGVDHTPIVAITANALEGEAEKCLAAGMDDYLSKPIEMPLLKQALAKWMPATAEAALDLGGVDVAPPPPIPVEPVVEQVAAEVAGEPAPAPEETDAAAASADGGVVDPAALQSMFGDDPDTIREIMQGFIEPSQKIVADIEAAFASRSAADIGAAAHKLKSAARSIGANALADLCQSLEAAGKSDDWDGIEESAPQVPDAMIQVADYINAL